MRLRFPASQVGHWANAYRIDKLEPALLGLRAQVQQQRYLSRDQLHLLARWKSARSAPRVLKNSPAYVEDVTGFALSASDERARIEALTILDGVLWPTASVVLHLFHAEPYPIIDIRALWSVGEKVPAQYTFGFWTRYVDYCRNVAQSQGVSMRVLDRALWQHSRAKQSS